MATKRKPARQQRLQTLPAYKPTGAEEALDGAVAGGDFIAGLDGTPAHWVIKRLSTGEVIHCPNVRATEVKARVALLNSCGGKPDAAANRSWGILMSAKPRKGKDGKLVEAIEGQLTAAQWFEYLAGPVTADALRAYVPAGDNKPPVLEFDALKKLMREAGGDLVDHVDNKMLDAVSSKLWSKLGIRRDGAAERWAKHNDPDSWDDGT